MEVWRLAAVIGVFLFASALIQPLTSASFLGMEVSISLIDLYAAAGGAVSGILPRQGSNQPKEAVKVTVGEIIALLITLIFYPATIMAGLAAAAKSKKALLTSGSLGLVWWVAAAYTVVSLRLSSGPTLQFDMAFATSLIGVALMFVAYLVPNRQI